MALGSLTEVQNQLILARDLGFIGMKVFDELMDLSIELSKMLNSLIKKSKSHINF